MTEEKELEIISYSILQHLMKDKNSVKKNPFEIFNEWSASSNITIEYSNNLRWALRFIKAEKGNPVLKSAALAAIVKEKEKNNGVNQFYCKKE